MCDLDPELVDEVMTNTQDLGVPDGRREIEDRTRDS